MCLLLAASLVCISCKKNKRAGEEATTRATAAATQGSASAAPGPRSAQGSQVAIEGYGIRLGLKPPFGCSRTPAGEQGGMEQFVVSRTEGDKISGVFILPARPSDPHAQLRRIEQPTPGYQLGSDGTRVLLSAGMADIDAIGSLEVGPMVPQWVVVSATGRAPWPKGKMIESTDAPPGYVVKEKPPKP